MHTQGAESLNVASQHGRLPNARRLPHRTESRDTRRAECLCTSAQTVTLLRVRIVLRRAECGENHMLFIVGIVTALIAVVIIPRMRVPGGVNSANLGWMSEQWLAEHRASHSL